MIHLDCYGFGGKGSRVRDSGFSEFGVVIYLDPYGYGGKGFRV